MSSIRQVGPVRCQPSPSPWSISNTVCQPPFLAAPLPINRFELSFGKSESQFAVQPKSDQKWNQAVPGQHGIRARRWISPDVSIRISDNNALAGRPDRLFDHPWLVITDAQGRFTLPSLPPGHYEVEAIHRRCGTPNQFHRRPGPRTSPTFTMRPPQEVPTR